MGRNAKTLSVLACVAMLAIQASGTHLHAAIGDHHDDGPHGVHVEHAISSTHTADLHEHHVDLAVFETASGFSTVDPALPVAHVFVPSPAPLAQARWFVPDVAPPPWRFSKLRPPLRAPPL